MNPKTPVPQELLHWLHDPARWMAGLVIAGRVCLILGVVLSLAAPVQAAPPGQTPAPGIDQITTMFKQLGGLFVQIAFSLMFIVFAVGSVKNGLGAQVAHQFGNSHRLSDELLNLAGGVAIFALGLLTLTLVNLVIGKVQGNFSTDFSIPNISINIK